MGQVAKIEIEANSGPEGTKGAIFDDQHASACGLPAMVAQMAHRSPEAILRRRDAWFSH